MSLFELCVESVESALAGERGGADRVEHCVQLAVGGVTPPMALIAATLQALKIPTHVLIRPRAGDFVYTAAEFEKMRQEIAEVKRMGAAGVVLGVLLPGNRVDVDRSRELVALARPMNVTFHRAFDEMPDPVAALQAVVETGADCLLTSGGAPDVLRGAAVLAHLAQVAQGRILIMAGGGLTLENLTEVVRQAGIRSLHGSLTRRAQGAKPGTPANGAALLEQDVGAAQRLLHSC